LAALGHFNAVKRAAVTAEQARNKVASATELASLGVELLPPIFMVALVGRDSLWLGTSTFSRLFTDTICEVVESVAKTIALETSEEISLLADGPSPLIHGTGPVSKVFILAGRLKANLAIEASSVGIVVLSVLEGVANTLTRDPVAHTIVAVAVGLTLFIVAVLAAFIFNAASPTSPWVTGAETCQSVACTLA